MNVVMDWETAYLECEDERRRLEARLEQTERERDAWRESDKLSREVNRAALARAEAAERERDALRLLLDESQDARVALASSEGEER